MGHTTNRWTSSRTKDCGDASRQFGMVLGTGFDPKINTKKPLILSGTCGLGKPVVWLSCPFLVQACLCKLCAHCWEAGAPPCLGRLEAGDCKLRLFLFFVVFVSLLCLCVQALFARCWEAVAPPCLSGREAGDCEFPLDLLRQAGQACLVFCWCWRLFSWKFTLLCSPSSSCSFWQVAIAIMFKLDSESSWCSTMSSFQARRGCKKEAGCSSSKLTCNRLERSLERKLTLWL